MSNPNNTTLELSVDKLGYLRAQIADLEAQAKELSAQVQQALLDGGDDFYDGALFRAVLITREGTKTDWKAIAEKLEPSRQLVTAHTVPTFSQLVKINARKKAAA